MFGKRQNNDNITLSFENDPNLAFKLDFKKNTAFKFYSLIFIFFAIAFIMFFAVVVGVYNIIFKIGTDANSTISQFFFRHSIAIGATFLVLFIIFILSSLFIYRLPLWLLPVVYPIVAIVMGVLVGTAFFAYTVLANTGTNFTVPLLIVFAPMGLMIILAVLTYFNVFNIFSVTRLMVALSVFALILIIIEIFVVGRYYSYLDATISGIMVVLVSGGMIVNFINIQKRTEAIGYASTKELVHTALLYGLSLFIDYAYAVYYLLRLAIILLRVTKN